MRYYSLFVILYSVTEEYDLVANPVYNISMQHTPQQRMITVATTTREDAADVIYEEVTI